MSLWSPGPAPLGPPQHGLHPLDQLLDGERLGDVVVDAEAQTLDLVGGRVAGSQEDDRHARAGALVLAQAPGHLEAVEVGQHHVEQDQVGTARLDRGERGPPDAARSHLETVDTRGAIATSSVMCSSSSTART